MESMHSILGQLKQFQQKQGMLTIEQRADRAYRHPLLRRWMEQNGELSHEALQSSLADVLQFIREGEQCNRCPGLNTCPNTMQGYQSELYKEQDNRIGLRMKKCDKLLHREEQHRREQLIRSHHVPMSILQATFQSIERDAKRLDALSALMEFCLHYQHGKPMKGLFLYGPLGVGKSHMMGAAARKMADRGIASLMVYVPDFFREIKEAIGENNLNEKIDALKTVPVLILDDIGAETLSPWARDEVLGTILQHRVNHALPTLYTSNYDLEGLEEHLAHSHRGGVEALKAKRIMERIRHYVDVYFVDGMNRRK